MPVSSVCACRFAACSGADFSVTGKEAAVLGRTMTRHASADDGSGLHVECGKQRCRAVPLVVMGAPFGLPRAHRQDRLGSVEHLGLRLFVDAQHHIAIRRVEIQADDIAHLLDEQGSVESLNRTSDL
jgi:hypothetical protein